MKMKVNNLPYTLTICLFASLLFSCVPARQFEDVKKREADCREENTKLKDSNQELTTENTELKASSSEMQRNLLKLQSDTSQLGTANQRLSGLYNELIKSYDNLLSNNEKLLAGNSEETRKLVLQLGQTRTELNMQQDRLKKDSIALNEREKKMNELNQEMLLKQARVDELEAVIRKNDSTMNMLKNTISKALMGYENNGLTVHEKDGRVYVSMEEQLLFSSGSTNVQKKGESALKDLSGVLASNKDINILVEGHTDNIPINGKLPSGATDNWELSVLRATSVVKIILSDKSIEPTRVTATGKGPYQPIDNANTTEARKKNRRTEIILSPKLDELAKALGIDK